MKVLMVTPDLPAPPQSGGRVRAFHLLRELGRRHAMDVLAPGLPEPEALDASRRVSRKLCLFSAPDEGPVARWNRRARSVLVGRLHHPQPAVRAALAGALAAESYDVLHLLTPYLVPSLPRRPGLPPVLVDFLGTSVGAWRDMRLAPHLVGRLFRLARWSAAVRGERHVLRRVDAALAISEDDHRYLRRLADGARIRVVPNGVDAYHFAPRPEPCDARSVTFVGDMSFAPNVDGALHFARTVLPQLRNEVPDATLWLVGRQPAPEVAALGSLPGITVTGTVPDVRPYLSRAAVVVVPLRGGSGVRNKTLEAMAMGCAVVSTTMGIEGLEVEPGRDLIVADDPADFARSVAALLRAPERGLALGRAARTRVLTAYTWEVSARRTEAVYAELVAGARRRQASW